MAGPYTGAWRAAQVSEVGYTGITKWGTGVNPIHSQYGSGPPRGKPKLTYYPESPPGGENTESFADDMGGMGYWPEDNPSQYYAYNVNDPDTWGAGSDTGTADRPLRNTEDSDPFSNETGWGLPNPPVDPRTLPADPRAKTQNSTRSNFPSWGGSRKPLPGGSVIRSIVHGDSLISKARVLPNEDVAQGWLNKEHGTPGDARPADDSQVFIQTSMVQRYKTRAGSQNIGSQSTFAAPIESRVVGKKVKQYSVPESSRHWEMLPYQQEDYIRPFLMRQAGTGYREWNYPNEMYVSPAIQREPPPDPELGPVSMTDSNDWGYSYEDGSW